MVEKNCVVVLELGGGDIKVGFDGEQGPTHVVPNVVGHSTKNSKYAFGENAIKLDGTEEMTVVRPMQNG